MPKNSQSESSKELSPLQEATDELLDCLDEARDLPDLRSSLRIQKNIIKILLGLLE